MKARLITLALLVLFVQMLSCGGKQPKGQDGSGGGGGASGSTDEQEEAEKVEEAKSKIQEWLGTDLAEQLSSIGKDIGKNVGQQLASDPDVMASAKALSGAIFADPEIARELKIISDKATAGLGNKITLGWKALQAGGIEAYKQKVRADATRVAVDVLIYHIKNNLLKDERMTKILKDVSPALKMQGTVIAASVQENLSTRVTTKILSIALKIAASTDKEKTAEKVENWIENCDGYAGDKAAEFITEFAELDSIKKAVRDLAVDVLSHQRTKTELVIMTQNLLRNQEVHNSLIKVYEAASFDKGDKAIQDALWKTIGLPIVNQELFAAMERLGSAEGASGVIARHVGPATKNPVIGEMVEDFVIGVLEACGDPTEKGN